MGVTTEKIYGTRKVAPRNGEYAVLAIPKQALQDADFDVERGREVEIKGIVEQSGETYLKIGGE